MTDPKVTEGRLVGIYFYNVYKEGGLIIWYVSYMPSDSNELDFVLVVHELSRQHLMLLPNDFQNPTVQELGLKTILWEQQIRLENQWISKMYSNKSSLLLFIQNSNKLLIGLEIAAKAHTPNPFLSGAYLFSQSNQSFSCNLQLSDADSNKIWSHEMIRSMTVNDISIFIKTTWGIYECHSDPDEPVNKQSKINKIKVTDVFQTLDHVLTWKNYKIKLKLITTRFQVLFVNPEGVWNACIPEFFRALFGKVLLGFAGLPPTYFYVFPTAVSQGTPFPPLFPAFPFTKIIFHSPQKITINELHDEYFEDFILLHWSPFSFSDMGDAIICPQKPHVLENSPSMWPLGVCELNSKLCEENLQHQIKITDCHYLLTLDLSHALCNFYGKNLKRHMQHFLDSITTYGSKALVKSLKDIYNTLLARIFSWAKQTEFVWVAIDKWKIVLFTLENSNFKVSFFYCES
nr:helicase-primase subunit [Macronycteris gammaherpesvirus 1]